MWVPYLLPLDTPIWVRWYMVGLTSTQYESIRETTSFDNHPPEGVKWGYPEGS